MDPTGALMRHDRAERVWRPSIRRATDEDLAGIMEIEQASFPAPWPASAMEDEVSRRSWSRVVLAVDRETIVGFMVYWVVDRELHLLNLATRPRWRRRGIARAMIEHLLGESRRTGRWQVVLEVRQTNDAAKKLYEGFGFRQVGIRRRYYADNDEDAIVMALAFDGRDREIE
jgi:ribosomal-protein-alanine N-acetyltransferase